MYFSFLNHFLKYWYANIKKKKKELNECTIHQVDIQFLNVVSCFPKRKTLYWEYILTLS